MFISSGMQTMVRPFAGAQMGWAEAKFSVKTVAYDYRVDRHQMAFIKFIIESYEGVAIMSTLDSAAGIVRLRVAPGCEAVVEALVGDLRRQIRMEPLPMQRSPSAAEGGLPGDRTLM